MTVFSDFSNSVRSGLTQSKVEKTPVPSDSHNSLGYYSTPRLTVCDRFPYTSFEHVIVQYCCVQHWRPRSQYISSTVRCCRHTGPPLSLQSATPRYHPVQHTTARVRRVQPNRTAHGTCHYMTVHCMAGQYRHKSTAHHATTRHVFCLLYTSPSPRD